jgi:ribonuclease HI
VSDRAQLAYPPATGSLLSGLEVVVEADGSSRGNPGPASCGAIVFEAGTNDSLADRGERLGVRTSNFAEYSGLILGLEMAAELGATSVKVRMDSQLVVKQMTGEFAVHKESLRPLHAKATGLRTQFQSVAFLWVPREENVLADGIANAAQDGVLWELPAGPIDVRW